MAESTTNVAKAIRKIQTTLLDRSSCTTPQLLAAGALLSRPDYDDILTERSITNLCGYPCCPNPLPIDRPRKGRYRISLKEHRVYDLQDTYRFCSDACLVGSKAFEGTLKEERCLQVGNGRIAELVQEFEKRIKVGVGERSELLLKDGDLGMSKLTIKEKSDVGNSVASLEEWIGPSDAIEGYVPKQDKKQGLKPKTKPKSESRLSVHNRDFDTTWKEVEFMSDVSIADPFDAPDKDVSLFDGGNHSKKKDMTSTKREMVIERPCNSGESQTSYNDTLSSLAQNLENMDFSDSKMKQKEQTLKPSLKQQGSKRRQLSIKWANEDKERSPVTRVVEIEGSKRPQISNELESMSPERLASAEACAAALLQASVAVTSGEAEVEDAVSESGIIIIPPKSHDDGEAKSERNEDDLEYCRNTGKWPKKPVLLDTDVFDVEDSWHDTPPEGFNLSLSTFATMWMALFGWITCSSLAYVYGRDDNSSDEFLFVNGREYPRQIVLSDGRSSEIKQTLAGCIARTLPQLVSDLRLPTPLSIIEKELAQLLDTLSFVDALPPFKTKEWHVIILLFIDALSVFRIPGLVEHMVDKRILLHKVLGAANVGGEEYETMKDLIIPLGRLPHLSLQSGA